MFPSKLVAERLTIEFNFLDLMDELGDSIASNFCTAEVITGTDPNPNQIFYGFATHVGLNVTQQVQLGIPGVIYRVFCTVVGTSGRVYVKSGALAIFPTPALPPPLFGELYTTTVYPIEVLEGLDVVGDIETGVLRSFFFPSTIEGTDTAAVAMFGQLRPANVLYTCPPEGVDTTAFPATGTLRMVFISYTNWPPEAVNVTAQPTTGTLAVKLVTYPNWPPEAVDVTANPISGTLV